ncbi:hypothetical protein ILUMI_19336 [Ignelater luminosus]|uniref:Uncharacterized protein n=1 Tax=Ignelater luminosus TaxID=2038154 RepID=A0A8K0CML4_IGNLU|nr:hypothetical protein ILUMI_19336 [Ignelater luminosus]
MRLEQLSTSNKHNMDTKIFLMTILALFCLMFDGATQLNFNFLPPATSKKCNSNQDCKRLRLGRCISTKRCALPASTIGGPMFHSWAKQGICCRAANVGKEIIEVITNYVFIFSIL